MRLRAGNHSGDPAFQRVVERTAFSAVLINKQLLRIGKPKDAFNNIMMKNALKRTAYHIHTAVFHGHTGITEDQNMAEPAASLNIYSL